MAPRWIATVVAGCALCGLSACHRARTVAAEAPGERSDDPGRAPAVPFEVRRESSDFTFFWFDAHGAAHAVTGVDDVPQGNRRVVRVDPPRPEQREPGWVYVADLRAPGAGGRYAVRAVSSEQLASDLAAINGLAAAMAVPSPAMPAVPAAPPSVLAPAIEPPGPRPGAHGTEQARVVIYGASWCSACHQAAGWLRAQGIPFIEHDIEQEPAVAQEMYARARQQGVPTGSIPIIDVNGRLMVGFNPAALEQAIRGG